VDSTGQRNARSKFSAWCLKGQHFARPRNEFQRNGIKLMATNPANTWQADRKTRDAVVRDLEVIGEACNNVAKNHPAFASQHSEVPWGFAYEMRNALSNGYFTVYHAIVWQTIQQDPAKLRSQIPALS